MSEKPVARYRLPGHAIQLRAPKSIPLESEAARVVLLRYKTRYPTHDWICGHAGAAGQRSRFDVALASALDFESERAPAFRAHEQVHQIKVHCSVVFSERLRLCATAILAGRVKGTSWYATVDKPVNDKWPLLYLRTRAASLTVLLLFKEFH